MDKGLNDEVKLLYNYRKDLNTNLPSLRIIGYNQILKYLYGEYRVDFMFQRVVFANKMLAKRRCSWLKTWKNLHFLYMNKWNDEVNVKQVLCSKLIKSKVDLNVIYVK